MRHTSRAPAAAHNATGLPAKQARRTNGHIYTQVGRAAAVQPLLPRACCCLRQLRREVVPGRPMHCMQQRSQLACNQTEAGPLHLTFYIALSNRREASPKYLQTVGKHKWCWQGKGLRCRLRCCRPVAVWGTSNQSLLLERLSQVSPLTCAL